MSPQRIQAVADPVMAKTAAAGSAAASALSILQDVAVGAFGMPLGVPLAALAATLYGITYREPMSGAKLWLNIAAGTIVSSSSAPLLQYYLGTPPVALAGVAAAIAFVLQYARPWLKARRDRLLDGAADRVLGAAPASAPADEEGKS